MKPERFQDLEAAFHRILPLDDPERGAALEELDAELRSAVADLLAAHQASEAPRAAKRLGPWEIGAKIGSGAMGTVYRAHRADGAFALEAAIKTLPILAEGSFLAERLQVETQILASLDHPSIARLYDAGVSPEGTPFLVMEFINGRPITEFATQLRLAVQLLASAADAVAFAHQRMILHRDLKPAHILVCPDQTVKLLDFGMAKVLREDIPGQRTKYLAYTREYAAPELMRGQPAGPGVDCYALGVILREINEGRDADLEAVAAKATREEPQERYASVAEFAAELRAWQANQPLAARRGERAYAIRKFLQRYWLPVSAALAVFLTLAVAVGVVFRQYQMAQARLAEFRQLNGTLTGELLSAIAEIPGSTAAARLLVARAVESLERLRAQSAGDETMNLDLARSYIQLANLQGNPFARNLGDSQGARRSLAQAVALLKPLSSSDARRWHASALVAVAQMEFAEGHSEAALLPAERAQALLDTLGAGPAKAGPAGLEADSLGLLGDIYLRLGKHEPAAAYYRRATDALRQRPAEGPTRALDLAKGYLKLGTTLLDTDPRQALHAFEQGLAELGASAAESRTAATLLYVRSNLLRKRAIGLSHLERASEAESAFSEARRAALVLVQRDPQDQQSRFNYTVTLNDASLHYGRQQDWRPALALANEVSSQLAREPGPFHARIRQEVELYAGLYEAKLGRSSARWQAALRQLEAWTETSDDRARLAEARAAVARLAAR